MLDQDIDQKLREYYRWAQAGAPDDVGYPHVTPERRLLGSSVGSIGLSDDEAMWIDRALAALKMESPEEYRTLQRIYQEGRSLRWMETRGLGDRRRLAQLADRGRLFVRGALFGAATEKSGGSTGTGA